MLHNGTATGEPVLVPAVLQEMQVPVVAVPPMECAALGLDLSKGEATGPVSQAKPKWCVRNRFDVTRS